MLSIEAIPAFDDNYIWLLSSPETGRAAVVDPGDAAPVIDALERAQLELDSILITHHHFDHIGGLKALCERYSPTVYAPQNPDIQPATQRLTDGDEVAVLGACFRVMAVPGHTLDHIAYFHSGEQPLLFCGDTLFAGGCGRVFEGTPAMMHNSLSELASLPVNTRIYCAHEYTLANLAFARAVEPDNSALAIRQEEAEATRGRGEPTVPSDLALELATNPFMRCTQPEMLEALRAHGRLQGESGPEVFAAVRGWKDNF